MSQHRAGSERRRAAAPQSRHRAEVRPRYGRIVTLTASLAVIVVAVMGAAGLLPTGPGDADPAAAIDDGSGDRPDSSSQDRPVPQLTDTGSEAPGEADLATETDDTTLPQGSGTGRRVVFSESRQRVWLVDESAQVVRTYEVSGSLTDNLDTGTFHVYSRSESAVGVDDSGTMRWFVRFTQGDEGAAIGFHDIPIDDGQPVQTIAQLGTPQSHGCIRQRTADALALWDFAPVGTTVVVTA